MAFFEHTILGLVQGLTEFLPISSSGHLILARDVLGVSGAAGLTVDAVLHFATALAVLLYFRGDIIRLCANAWRWLRGAEYERREAVLAGAIAVATVPAVIGGLLLEQTMATLFRTPALVAYALIAGSVVMAAAEWYWRRFPQTNAVTLRRGFLVGCAQTLALVPGMSRSGMAIAGGLGLGLERETAARFAFLLAVPLLLGAGSKKMLELAGQGGGTAELAPIVLAAFVAFATGLLAIHVLLAFIRRYTLMTFVYYRLLLAGAVLVFLV